MKYRPILFKSEMVKAILNYSKTMTRRLNGLEDVNSYPGILEGDTNCLGPLGYRGLMGSSYYLKQSSKIKYKKNPGLYHWFFGSKEREFNPIPVRCPYGVVGDRLWVKETWAVTGTYFDTKTSEIPHHALSLDVLEYKATCQYPDAGYYKWRSAMFMPLWASRIVLEITGIRAERLQNISRYDAISEGISKKLSTE